MKSIKLIALPLIFFAFSIVQADDADYKTQCSYKISGYKPAYKYKDTIKVTLKKTELAETTPSDCLASAIYDSNQNYQTNYLAGGQYRTYFAKPVKILIKILQQDNILFPQQKLIEQIGLQTCFQIRKPFEFKSTDDADYYVTVLERTESCN